ncbi:MAG: hypothetical protein M1826_004561 [Phylliscum demangeonii]|nr:MAG: hypothetical protein M1826_004561 [Phylliscum demangeonii]
MGVGRRWSSNASTLSDDSQSSASSGRSSDSVCICGHEHSSLSWLKMLILRAVMKIGLSASDQTLYTWSKALILTSFGAAPWQMDLLDQYRRMILIGSDSPRQPTAASHPDPDDGATQLGHGARYRDANAIWISTSDELHLSVAPLARRRSCQLPQHPTETAHARAT